ncbi:hypothetical protein EPUS_02862 [Endocarpon pusillum Z07020]|uniref:Uncharacterized protein n=1 Tax=Endocarpon pusillum (strain Z07020 / HMAS-L-300199) TaxID=1263415 RepID=U1HQ89_ENDPU|nr:uncharacterized protein EPUS_02862 [Endocarpon pusillum Z07020]ERF72580.1 hypothetical protein EPUS_02862 [Endocarpon pusillum Z07020]
MNHSPRTPFEDFYILVAHLWDSDFARQLQSSSHYHPLWGPLFSLHERTTRVKSGYDRRRPDTAWNKPFVHGGLSSSLNKFSELEADNCELEADNYKLKGKLDKCKDDLNKANYDLNKANDDLNKANNDLNRANYDLNKANDDLNKANYDLSKANDDLNKANDDLNKANDDLNKANEMIDQHRASLAAAHETFQELGTQIDGDRATIERLRVRAADEYIRTKQYSLAVEQYEQLVVLKGKEKKEKAKLEDREGEREAREAEEAQLGYIFDCGKAYALDGRYDDAVKELRFVLKEMERRGIRNVERADTRDVQTQLCDVLRRQGNTEEAGRLYYHAGWLDGLQNRNEADRSWALQNATSYAQLLVEQKEYEAAKAQLTKIWRNRHQATASKVEDLEAEVCKITTMLEEKRQTRLVIDLLKMVCDNQNGAALSKQVLHNHAKLGILLHDRGKPDHDEPKDLDRHDHARAIPYLRQAWVRRQQLVLGIDQSTGWTLALLLVSRSHLLEAKNVLADLLCLTNGNKTSQSVSKDQILALLAHVQFYMGDFSVAESNAAALFRRLGVKNVFTSVSSSAVDFSTCHHADTLIRACSRQDSVEKFKAAKDVWAVIYKSRIDIMATSKAQLKEHAAAGATFADNWKRSAEKRKKRPTSAMEIEKQVKQVQAMTG